jgi:hypothetical protein
MRRRLEPQGDSGSTKITQDFAAPAPDYFLEFWSDNKRGISEKSPFFHHIIEILDKRATGMDVVFIID